ncbi:hypothetical protein MVEN_01478900 [Mycena venus]|uniref:Uncharacterized protein n=1 Tax=Mycena venus TaxID=2733690 RepID=A0A8H6XVL1_9AGAR|nr:hypothetical protein MVEN_01478900 [Mycena venus]
MSSQTARRTQLASPKRATFKRHSPKPILKRPSPLNLVSNPFPSTSGITIVVSPSPAISSPHVHFPASPILTVVFSTHSPNSYDRTATQVVPNPLELPGWGQRVYSPGKGTFSSVKSPTVDGPMLFVGSPPVAEQEDKALKTVRIVARPRELGKALSVYPRTPYPSAPTSPMSKGKENAQGRVGRAKSLDSTRSKRGRPASLNIPAGRPATPRVSFPLSANQFLSPVAELDLAATVTLASTRLNQEFWESISLEDGDVSAMEAHDESSTPISAVPRFIFGKGGLLWSPGLPPKESSSVAEIRSPADRTAFEFEKSDRWMITSPADHPPAYPTIATVLSMDATTIRYSPPVVQGGGMT